MRETLTKRALAYAQRLVRIESVSFRERPCAEELAGILEGLGFRTYIDEGNNLVARLHGRQSDAPTLLFIGHHDTVDLGDLSEWDYPPLDAVVENGKLHGRGSNDEKGGLAAFLAAMETLLENDMRPAGDILLISTREEIADLSQRGILQVLRRAGIGPGGEAVGGAAQTGRDADGETTADEAISLQADACICLEPTETTLMLGHRGRAVADFSLRGRAAHASMPARGTNAIEKAAALVQVIQEMPMPAGTASSRGLVGSVTAPEEGTTWPPLEDWTGTQAVTMIRGGTRENIIPEECTVTVDRRILDGEDEHTVAAEYREVIGRLQKADPEMEVSFQIRPPYYAALTDREDGFVRRVQAILRDMDHPDLPEIFPGHTDAEWVINDMGIPCVILGPGSLSTAHTAREYVPVADLGFCAEVYYRTCLALGAGCW